MRIGIGYDIHRLVEGRTMVIGGVEIPHVSGPEGHSDGDVLIHAVCDAILGAMAAGDIGQRYPDTDPRYEGIAGAELLEDVRKLMDSNGFRVGNLDCVVIAEEPKISPYRDKIAESISVILLVPREAVSVKGKTAEKIGTIGAGKAIAAHAVVLLEERK